MLARNLRLIFLQFVEPEIRQPSIRLQITQKQARKTDSSVIHAICAQMLLSNAKKSKVQGLIEESFQ